MIGAALALAGSLVVAELFCIGVVSLLRLWRGVAS